AKSGANRIGRPRFGKAARTVNRTSSSERLIKAMLGEISFLRSSALGSLSESTLNCTMSPSPDADDPAPDAPELPDAPPDLPCPAELPPSVAAGTMPAPPMAARLKGLPPDAPRIRPMASPGPRPGIWPGAAAGCSESLRGRDRAIDVLTIAWNDPGKLARTEERPSRTSVTPSPINRPGTGSQAFCNSPEGFQSFCFIAVSAVCTASDAVDRTRYFPSS